MSESKKLIPKRRFREFKEVKEWKTVYLKNVTKTLSYGLNAAAKKYDGYNKYLRITDIDDESREFKNDSLTSPDIDLTLAKNYKLKIGDILFARTGASVGKTYHYKKSDGTVYYAGFLICLRLKTLCSSDFIYQNTLTKKYKKFIQLTSQRSGQPGVNAQEYASFVLAIPNFKEQIQIGNFFKKIDNLIQTQRKKLQKIKTLKLAYLAEMFPCDGELKPKLRFKGFSDNWECKPLFTITNHRGGIAIERYFSSEGRYKVISIGSYGLDGQYIDQNIRVLANEKTNGLLVKKNELTMVLNDKTLNGSIIGRVLLIDENDTYVINQRTEIISPKDFFESRFAYVALNNNFREKVKKIVQGGTQIYVNYTFVENLYIEIPTINEQTKIGNFFKLLDSKIALEQKKLEKLNNIKQAYLNEMFV